MRIASSASTRLRLSARSRPINSAMPESLTSAFGAVATMARSWSRTTISRIRTAMRIRPARSIWRAADLDGVAVTDILLDRRRKPRRRHVEIDRAGAQPPPQAEEAAGEDHRQRRDDDRKPPDPAFTDDPSLQRRRTCRRSCGCPSSASTTAGARDGRQPRHARAPTHHRSTPGSGCGCLCWACGDGFRAMGSRCRRSPWGCRRSGRARRQGEAAPVRASVPIPD